MCCDLFYHILKVCTVALFDKEEIHQDLHLVVAESQDESKFVVFGEMYVYFVHSSNFDLAFFISCLIRLSCEKHFSVS